jgi:hypothetical protein
MSAQQVLDHGQGADVLLSVVIPVYNEERILQTNLMSYARALDIVVGKGRWKYVLVDNGSTDSTPQIIEEIRRALPLTVGLHCPTPNYGAAVRTGLSAVDTEYAHNIDVEQWDVPFVTWAWRFRERYDLFIASKRADPTLNRQPLLRYLLSWGLNALLQLLFDFTGTETHGPKVMRMSAMKPIIDASTSDRGQYDTEIVLRAVRASVRIVELPVAHTEVRPPRAVVIKKIVWNVIALLRLWSKMRHEPFKGQMRYHRFAREDVMAEVVPELADIRPVSSRHGPPESVPPQRSAA